MNIPSEIIVFEIIPLLSLIEIYRLYQTNHAMRKLCKEEQLWHTILVRDFPNAGSKTIFWFNFYIESYKYSRLIRHKYNDALMKPNDISYMKYHQMLESAHKIPLTITFATDKEDQNSNRIYVIPSVTTLGSFLQNIENKIGHINYKLSFEVYGIVELEKCLYLFPKMIYKIDNNYIMRDSLVRSTTDNAITNVFRYRNLKMIVCEEDYCPYTFHLSDEYFKSYLIP